MLSHYLQNLKLTLLTVEEAEKRDHVPPAFVTKKSDGTIRIVVDLRKLNANIEQRSMHLNTGDEILSSVISFQYGSVIDLNMGYHSIKLCGKTEELFTVMFPFGYFEMNVLPTGAKPTTDIFQGRVTGMFATMQTKKPNPYLDDIFHTKGRNFQEHLAILCEIFTRLLKSGMLNLKKSVLCAFKFEFLGREITKKGIRPTTKYISAVLKLKEPKNRKQVRGFLGTINFIKNHIHNRAHIMQPITELTKKDTPWKWGPKQKEAFRKTLAAVANAITTAHPNPNLPFILYLDASQTYAMGAVLCQMQNLIEVCVGVFSRKFTPAQLKYTVQQQELLGAYEGCRHFAPIITGCDVNIRIHHKNNIYECAKAPNLRVTRQLVELDQEFQAKFEYFPGEKNTGADGFSRLRMHDKIPDGMLNKVYNIDMLDRTINECFPISMKLVKEAQDKDQDLQALLAQGTHGNKFSTQEYNNISVHTFKGKVWVPKDHQERIIDWYHTNLNHAGSTRTINSISVTFGWKGLHKQGKDYISHCDVCQKNKTVGQKSTAWFLLHDFKPQKGRLGLHGTLENQGQNQHPQTWICRLQRHNVRGELSL